MKSNILNNEIDSKMSISSISCISALFNSNNKNFIFKSFNSKLIKEVHESNFTLNNINNNNNKYLDSFHVNNNVDNIRNKKFIWNKKKVYKNSQKINSINDNDNEKNSPIIYIKEKYLKMLIMKYSNNSKLILYKYFMKLYLNSVLYINKKCLKNNNIDFALLKKQKLIQIIDKKKIRVKNIINMHFNKFHFKGLVNFMNNHWYYMDNGGRLKDINQNPFFIYEIKKNIKKDDDNYKDNNQNRNIAKILKINRIIKKILFQDKNMNKEKLKIYFYKFHLSGIIFYMKKELKKKIISRKLSLLEKKNLNFIKRDDEEEIQNQKIKILKRIINKKNKICFYIFKNVFNKWNLRTKIFSMIAIDKEKKKKRRIKKRNNKKLGANNQNNKNNNLNLSNNSNIINNTNKKIHSPNLSCPVGLENKNKIINKPNYYIENIASVIFSNNIKINDYYKLNKFIEKINLIITKKYYFFNLLYNDYNNKKDKQNNGVKNIINEDIDFFIEDSSENSED